MNTLIRFLRATIIGGLLFLVPVVLLILILEKALGLAKQVITPVVHYFPNRPVFGVAVATIVAILALLLVSFLAGLTAQTEAGKSFAAWAERVFLSKLPGYTMYRSMVGDLTESVASLESNATATAVLVRIEDAWQLGFVTDELDSGELVVFVPGAPSPLSGSLYILTKDRVRDSGISMSEATAVLRRIGVGAKDRLRGKV